jgi:PBSX family phage terminase large subunit
MYGSVRSGKTEIQQYCALKAVKCLPPGNIQFIGKTIGALQRNFIIPLQQKFPGYVAYNRSTKTIKIFGRECWVEGATNEGAVERIQGESLVAAFGDEVVTWPQSFFEMLDTRLSDQGSVFLGSMNPGPPKHYIKKLIDQEEELGTALDGRRELRSWRFILDENTFLDPSYIASLKKKYPPGSVLYRRFIEGLWVAAEGAIYPHYESAVVKETPHCDMFVVGVDVGSTNPTVYLLLGKSEGTWYVLKESYIQEFGWVNSQYSKELKPVIEGTFPRYIDVDHDPAFIAQLRQDYPGTDIRFAIKDVLSGIETVAQMMFSGKLKISEKCPKLLEELSGYIWDAKAQERGEDAPVKANDHACDALRYACMRIKHSLGGING